MRKLNILSGLVAAVLLLACSGESSPASVSTPSLSIVTRPPQSTAVEPSATSTVRTPTPVPPAPPATFADPFAYCAAVGTIDAPDERYAGPHSPTIIADRLRAMGLRVNRSGQDWRCVNGALLGCGVAIRDWCGLADPGRDPSAQMRDYCARFLNLSFVEPGTMPGTIYSWRCQDGSPALDAPILTIDAHGFIAEYWHRIARPLLLGGDARPSDEPHEVLIDWILTGSPSLTRAQIRPACDGLREDEACAFLYRDGGAALWYKVGSFVDIGIVRLDADEPAGRVKVCGTQEC